MAKKAVAKQEMLVVGSKVKALIKGRKCMTAGDTLEALNKKVAEVVVAATERAKANKRSTVRPQDL